jgi:hypothetical protein
MKLSKILSEAISEAESPAAQQAHHLGLQSSAYGNWKDETGKVVAKSVKGGEALVKTEPGDEGEEDEQEPEELPEPTPDAVEEPEDVLAPTTPDTPDDEYVPPQNNYGIVAPPEPEGAFASGGGDVSRALTILAKKYHESQGSPERQAQIKAKIQAVQQAEEAEKQNMIDALARVQARKDAEKKAIRDKMANNPKYASLLQNPNKDL